MTDAPYPFDFFHKVTNCHFGGGSWFFASFELGVTVPANAGIDFPRMSGGTPGFNMLPGNWPNFPHATTAAEIIPRRTLAGVGLITCFGINSITVPAIPPSPLSTQISYDDGSIQLQGYTKTQQLFFKTPDQNLFHVRLSIAGASSLRAVCVCQVADKQVVAGLQAPLPVPAWPSTSQASWVEGSSAAINQEFICDPVKKTVVIV